jgi:hypothetical protein
MIPNFLDDTGPSTDDRSWTGKLRFWVFFFGLFWTMIWIGDGTGCKRDADRRTMPSSLMRWMMRRTSLLLFSAFPLVVRHQLAFFSVYQSMHMGPGVFRCMDLTNWDCRCFLGYQSSCLEQHLGAFGIVSAKRQRDGQDIQASAPFPPLFLGVARPLNLGGKCVI